MGDKITAKQTAKELGIPVVPGSEGEIKTPEEAIALAKGIGYPVIVKATAGGGGRGMKVARNDDEMRVAIMTARTEAKAAFGNDSVYIEKYLQKPRHIEVQLMGDGKGNAVHLGTRDCSLQRRHQKVWEEAPAPTVPADERDGDRRSLRRRHAQAQILGRRHHRVPLRGRRVLLHRDEHPPPGRAPGHRAHHRRRHRLRADHASPRAKRCR